MNLLELFVIAIGLSMDAFAAATCKGLSFRKFSLKNTIVVAMFFGVFQAGMPLAGYLLGVQFQDAITQIDHWIAFVLLSVIGINMMKDSRKCQHDLETGMACHVNDSPDYKELTFLALSTSIDALAVGVTFAFLDVHIVPAILFIGMITFIMSIIGVRIGNVFGIKYKSKAEFAGGLILILMGINLVLDHTGVLHML